MDHNDEQNHDQTPRLSLPSLVTIHADISRLRRELEALEDYLHQEELRTKQAIDKLPRTSRMLETFASDNSLDLIQREHRERLDAFLQDISSKAPLLHISFAVDPSSAFVSKLIIWLRQNIDPLLLLDIGLQPNIAAGCIIRTPNHQYDFSLRAHFAKQRQTLIEKLEAIHE